MAQRLVPCLSETIIARMFDLDVLLLAAEWRDTHQGVEITLWATSSEHGPIRATITGQQPVFFVPRSTKTLDGRRDARPLKTLQHNDVDAVYFKTQRALLAERDRLRAAGDQVFESDLKPTNRFLMERFINGSFNLRGSGRPENGVLRFHDPQVRAAEVVPTLRTLSLDIETDGWEGPVLSLAFAGCGIEQVLPVRPSDDERTVLQAAFALIRQLDPRRAPRVERGRLRFACASGALRDALDTLRDWAVW